MTVKATDAYGASTTRTIWIGTQIAPVTSADAGVANPAFGRGLDLLRDTGLGRGLEREDFRPTVLAADHPVFEPIFGKPAAPLEEPSASERLFALYKQTVDDERDAKLHTEEVRRDRAVERAVEKVERSDKSAARVTLNESAAELPSTQRRPSRARSLTRVSPLPLNAIRSMPAKASLPNPMISLRADR